MPTDANIWNGNMSQLCIIYAKTAHVINPSTYYNAMTNINETYQAQVPFHHWTGQMRDHSLEWNTVTN